MFLLIQKFVVASYLLNFFIILYITECQELKNFFSVIDENSATQICTSSVKPTKDFRLVHSLNFYLQLFNQKNFVSFDKSTMVTVFSYGFAVIVAKG